MPPKKASKNITTLCIRCPDLDTAEVCPSGKKGKTINDCSADSSSGNLWPGFSDDAGGVPPTDTAQSNAVLKAARGTSDSALSDATMDHFGNKPLQFDSVCKKRSGAQFVGAPLSKNMLEAAYQIVCAPVSALADQLDSAGISAQGGSAGASTPPKDFSPGDLGKTEAPDVTRLSTAQDSHRNQQVLYQQPSRQPFDTIPSKKAPAPKYMSSAKYTSFAPLKSSPKPKVKKPANDHERALQSPSYPLRPKLASTAETYQVLTNHFMLDIPDGTLLYEYAVEIECKRTQLSKPKKRMLINDMVETDPKLWSCSANIATDGKSKLLSSVPLYSTVHRIRVNDYQAGVSQDTPETAILVLKPTRVHDLSGLKQFVAGKDASYEDRGTADALNIFISNALVKNGSKDIFQLGNNKVYFRPGWSELQTTGDAESAGLIAVRGYFSAVKPAMGGILLNVNKVTSAFYKAQPLTEYLKFFPAASTKALANLKKDAAGLAKAKAASIKAAAEAEKHLVGRRVRIMFDRSTGSNDPSVDDESRRIKTIAGFGDVPDVQTIDTSGKTVWTHHKTKYSKVVEERAKDFFTVNVGSNDRPQYYLATQLNIVVDQPYRGTVPPSVTEKMIKEARQTPAANMNAILNEGLPALGLDQAKISCMTLKVDGHPASVPARMIKPPKLSYGSFQFTPTGASWKPMDNMSFGKKKSFGGRLSSAPAKVQFFRPTEMLKDCDHLLDWYIKSFMHLHNKVGMQEVTLLNRQNPYFIIGKDDWKDETRLQGILEKHTASGMNIAIVVFPNDKGDHKSYYSTFRFVADIKLGLHSICFNQDRIHKSLRNFRPSEFGDYNLPGLDALVDYVRNVAMKINLRGGNYNHLLTTESLQNLTGKDAAMCKTLVLGADVAHPTSGKFRNGPSVAAVVGSIDNTFAVMPGSARLNPSKQEWISDMATMVKERIREWSDNNGGRMPLRILYYRDGVSDSYFPFILDHEHQAIKNACAAMCKEQGKNPVDIKVTTVIVTKRHHVRFFPTNNQHVVKENCGPGTIVETGITHPYHFDFYLQSQHIMGGTAKPAHYFVLADEIGFTSEALQDLTYHLCFSYGRSLNTVSYVPPAYYADRLCDRANMYLNHFYNSAKANHLSEDATPEDIMKAAKDHIYGVTLDQNQNPWGNKHKGNMFWM